MKHLVRRSPRVVGSLQLWDRVVLTERSPGARSRVPLQGQFTLLVEAGTAGSDESSQRSRRELKILKSFMLLPDPPLVSSEPFSWMRQKGRRLNVTPADRCGCKKVDSGGFFAGNLQKSASYPRLEFSLPLLEFTQLRLLFIQEAPCWEVLLPGQEILHGLGRRKLHPLGKLSPSCIPCWTQALNRMPVHFCPGSRYPAE